MIVLINQSTGYLFVDVANELAKKEDVILLCNLQCKKSRLNPNIKVINIKGYDKSTIFKRLFTWIIGTIQAWWIVLFRYRYAKLLIVSNPPLANLISLLLPNNHVSHLIYDIYPDVLISANIIKKNSWLDKLWTKANRKVYLKADHIYTLGDGMADCLSQYVLRDRIEIIPLWPDTTGLYEVEKTENEFIKKNDLEGKFIVLYSGNLGNTHKVESIVEVAEKLKDNENIHFVMIGEGGKKNLITKMLNSYHLKNFTLLPYQSIEMLPHSLSCADIAIVTLDIKASQLSIPSKTFNLMYLGKTILCLSGAHSELAKLIDKYEIGKIYSPEDIIGISNFINLMADNPWMLEKYKQNSKKASSLFTPDNAKKFLI